MDGPCPICGNESTRVTLAKADGESVDCIRCGRFEVAGMFVAAMRNEPASEKWRWRLSCAIRSATDEAGRLHERVTTESYNEIISHARWPTDAIDQVNRLILAIAKLTTHVGAATDREHYEAWAARAWLPDAQAVKVMAGELQRMDMIGGPTRYDEGWQLALTLRGWEQATQLQRVHGTGTQAFVAMWFAKPMDRAFDDAIAPALRELGYDPYRVDRDAHDARIDDRIVAQVRRSRIIVVECTGVRQSVYFEAGFAYGLGLEVIWTCHDPSVLEAGHTLFGAPSPPKDPTDPKEPKPWFEQLSFDTRQYTCLQWASLDQLRAKIVDRVRARGLDLANIR